LSLKVMSEVWDFCPYEELSTFVVLLALADWSDDAGMSYPSHDTLAHKCRQSSRNVQYVIQRLKVDEVLHVEVHRGRNKTNRYYLNTQRLRVLFEQNSQAEHGKLAMAIADNPSVVKPSEGVKAADAKKALEELLDSYSQTLFAFYPRHKGTGAGRKAAASALRRLIEGKDVIPMDKMPPERAYEFLLAKVKEHAAFHKRERTQEKYIPLCATWMNQSRYLDCAEQATATQPSQQEFVPTASNPADEMRRQLRKDTR
jgi:hypothetical protein